MGRFQQNRELVSIYQKILSPITQRLIALFLVGVLLTSMLIPPASAFAANLQNQPKGNAKAIGAKSPPALPTVPSKQASAADAAQDIAGSKDQFLSKLTGKQTGEALTGAPEKANVPAHELTDKRTAMSSTYLNSDGTATEKDYVVPHFYKDGSDWKNIDTTLLEDKNAADSGNIFGKALGATESWFKGTSTYKMAGNNWQARFAPSTDDAGMVRLQQDGQTVSFRPVNAANVGPEITTDETGRQTVTYKDLWPNIDVQYQVRSNQLKEFVVLKNADAPTDYSFAVDGASLKSDPSNKGGFTLDGALAGDFEVAPLSVTLMDRGVISEEVAHQTFQDGKLSVHVDADWLHSVPAANFPIVIDPTFTSNFGTRASGNYEAHKSDGYNCGSTTCYPAAGSLNDAGTWKSWRGEFYMPYSQLSGHTLQSATFHLQQMPQTAGKYYGVYDTHTYTVSHATCHGYNCVDTGMSRVSVSMATSGNFNLTSIYQTLISRGDWGGWLIINGQEGTTTTLKMFDPDNSYTTFTYDVTPPTPTITAPLGSQTYTDPQVSFRVAAQTNPNNSTALQYHFKVTTGSDGQTGAVVDSSFVTSRQWTIPDGVLQDGNTYYVTATSYDSSLGRESTPTSPVPFKVDSRTGKDSTQTQDSVGPVGVDLGTGNMSTSASSHTSKALGGDLGVSLDYNSPMKSRPGLVGSYWNLPTNGTGIPTTAPDLQRVDQNVDFDWANGSPGSPINATWFAAQWNGYFVAPTTGTYYFGGLDDDNLRINISSQLIYNNGSGCTTNPCYGSAVSLTAGQVVPFQANYNQGTGGDYARIYVKGAVSEQTIPQAWFQTGVRPAATSHGLTGHYYAYNWTGTPPTIPSDPNTAFLTRTDPLISFNWGNGSPIPDGPSDGYMARWTGYFTAPATGAYSFGRTADDGTRIVVNGTTVLDDWTSGSHATKAYGSNVTLSAGQTVPITVDYFEAQNGANMTLYVKGAVSEQIVPTAWLSPKAQVLPDGWKLGIDPNGDVTYDHLNSGQNGVTLTDSSGDTHEYTWTGTGYKPPVNEDGQLAHNGDGTFTLIDTDGKTYVFGQDGVLQSVTNPVDDQHPAALQYTYSGSPAKITKVNDGVDSNRYAAVYYSGDSHCGSAPSGFDASAPANMLCAVQTNDGRTTYFYYLSGNLARIVQPGNETTDYQYDSLGRIVAMRDSTANDAINAGIRIADSSVLTQIGYDDIGRVASVTLPAANAGDSRQSQSFDYRPTISAISLNRHHITVGDHMAAVAAPSVSSAYTFEWSLGYLLTVPTTGTHMLYSCKIGTDEFTSMSSTCEGQTYIGQLGYAYDSAPAGLSSQPVYRCTIPSRSGEHMDSIDSTCENQHVEFILGYLLTTPTGVNPGYTMEHVTGAVEPNGFTRRVEYDSTFRTTKDTDAQNLSATTAWDPVKDLQLSTTDAKGLMSTTIYDDEDRAVSQYGSAPTSWFGSDRKPLSSYAAQVARTDTGYDENITGPAVQYQHYDSTLQSLNGAPFLHSTNIGGSSSAQVGQNFGASSPDPNVTTNWGMTMTGKLRLPSTGTYSFRINSDGGMRMWVDDNVVIDDWVDAPARDHPTYTFSNDTANAPHRFRIQYFHTTGNASFNLYMTPPGGTETPNTATYFSPDYSLQTSATAYDSTIGNTTVSANYGLNPELGLANSTTTDPSGLNLTSSTAYETQGATGSYLRQTSSSLPGGATTNYSYYAATDTMDNPCTTGTTEAYRQGGMTHVTTDPDPDGSGPQSGINTENIYDDAGNLVATRNNSDGWTCLTYDDRGRVVQAVTPTINGRAGRITATTYNYQGSPLQVRVDDSVAGSTIATTDLLGRQVSSTDVFGSTSTGSYDSLGRLASVVSAVGTESYAYDSFSRLTSYLLNGTTYATLAYDSFGRVQSVQYPQAKDSQGNTMSLSQVKHDALQRTNGATFQFSNGTTYDETITLSQSGRVLSTADSLGTVTANSAYTYDKAGRLTEATIDNMKYAYGFGAPSGATCNMSSANLNANKDSNRTSYTATNLSTSQVTSQYTYCYDQADRLIATSDPQTNAPTYDDHGNTTSLGGNGTPISFSYDASDQNTAVEQGTNRVEYVKASDGTVLRKKEYQNNQLTKSYRYITGGRVLQSCSLLDDSLCSNADTYLTLPGGVRLTLSPSNPDPNSQAIYSIANFHGDTALTADATGNTTSSVYLYEPFGQASQSATFGTNSNPANNSDSSMGWAASPNRKAEQQFSLAVMQMGARTYIPSLGRFLQTDPIPGGTPNAYVYTLDPINGSDYTGMFSLQGGAGATFLQPAAGATRVQHTAPPKQIQPAVSYASFRYVRTLTVVRNPAPKTKPKAKATPKAKPKVTAQNVTTIGRDWVVSHYNNNKPENFDLYEAAGTAVGFFDPGAGVGAGIGCSIGVLFFGVGCLFGGAIGLATGGPLGSIVGWYVGGYNSPHANDLDGMPSMDTELKPFKL